MIAPDGSAVVLGQHIDRRYRFCQCRICGVVKKCTPQDDFFTLPGDGLDTGLLCESCFDRAIGLRVDDERGDR